jgi:uncharacterized protein YbjT (DUF2867 family)
MKIAVMGASGESGKQVVALFRDAGHETVAASRRSGADVLTGAGLSGAMAGADVLVDVTNSPSFEDDAARRCCDSSGARFWHPADSYSMDSTKARASD